MPERGSGSRSKAAGPQRRDGRSEAAAGHRPAVRSDCGRAARGKRHFIL